MSNDNYKLKHIKFYANTDVMIENKRGYRKVFEEKEITYFNWEVMLFNRKYDIDEWKASINSKCFKINEGHKEMCNTIEEITIPKTVDNFPYRHSWGTETTGYWGAGTYLWEIYINNELAGTETMIIYNYGLITEEYNPYFDVTNIKMYVAYHDGREVTEGRRYLTQFDTGITEYIGFELNTTAKPIEAFNFELMYYIIREDGTPKSSFFNETNALEGHAGRGVHISYSWGTPNAGYWKRGNYTVYIMMMGKCISSANFTIGDSEILGAPTSIFAEGANKKMAQGEPGAAPQKTTEELLAEVDELVGMENVKKSIHENIAYLKFNKLRMEKGFKDDSAMNLHSVFTGNPGTGKTTVVRLLSGLYKSMGLLTKGHVVETGRSELIAEFIGQTAPKVKKVIADARGGLLFIDEAYALMRDQSDNKDFGREAIEILLKEMSDGPGDIAIVAAGYPAEMETFLNTNPGLKSRFKFFFHFDDYMPDELLDISKAALKKEEATLTDGALELLKNYVTEHYRNRDKSFGNGRLIYGIIDEAKKQMGIRLLKREDIETLSREEISTITEEDIAATLKQTNRRKLKLSIEEKELKDAIDELNELVGLTQIKKEIEDMSRLVRFYVETGKDVLNKFSLHAVLTGNPGTGKTTLARLLGKIYKALGLLERGHVVETDRQGLVAGFIGQTAIKTASLLDKANGGVLFIDEAYALAGSDNDFGQEAIETILKTMEDKRGSFSVIAAGYPDNMYTFLRMNPGLKSRFDKVYNLPDYTADEMLQIAILMFKKENLHLTDDAKEFLEKHFTKLLAAKDKFFGNARSVRQSVEQIIHKQNLRLAILPTANRTNEMLQQILLEDVQLDIQKDQRGNAIGFNR